MLLTFAALKESGLPDGLSQKGYYYIDLPRELVPDEQNDKGEGIFNPESPVELFHNGTIRAFGGIYTNWDESDRGEKPYRLKFHFVDIEDQVDIAAYFQYTAKIESDLAYGTTYGEVDFGGAGQISFTTQPELAKEVECDYKIDIQGLWDATDSTGISPASPNTKINWTTTITNEKTATFHGMMTLDMKDPEYGEHGFVSNWNNYHDSNKPPFEVWVTYMNDEQVQLTPYHMGYWVFYDPV